MWKNENYKVMKGIKLGKIDIGTPKNTINPFSKNYKFFLRASRLEPPPARRGGKPTL